MGITPGGPTAATFMSYGIGRRFSKAGARFGTGEPEGLVSSEVSDQAAGCAAMLPMLALGIPSSATAAVLLGGLMIWGLTPGPALFAERPDFVWGLIASMYVSNVVCVIMVLTTVPLFAAVLRAPFTITGPLIVIVCLVGAWTVGSATIDLWMVLAFGAIGYFMSRLQYPIAPLVLAMVLGDRAEDAFRQSMILSRGSLLVFWSNPLAGTVATLALLCFAFPAFTAVRRVFHR
jgi:TctA family transporter